MTYYANNEDAGDLAASLAAGASEVAMENWLEDRAREFAVYRDLYTKWKASAKPEHAKHYAGPPSCENCGTKFTEENCWGDQGVPGNFCLDCAAEFGAEIPEGVPGFTGRENIIMVDVKAAGYEEFGADL